MLLNYQFNNLFLKAMIYWNIYTIKVDILLLKEKWI